MDYPALKDRVSLMLGGLSETLYYHSPWHTLHDVLPAVERIAEAIGVTGEEMLLLQSAALLHDIGYLERYDNNEIIAAKMAGRLLPVYGYTPEQVDNICSLIMATSMPQRPQSLLQMVLCDADLDSLGREDFMTRGESLRQELLCHGYDADERDWLRRQFEFLANHCYFTSAARHMRDAGKEANLERLRRRL